MSGIKRFVLKFFALAAMLLGLPALGVVLAGYPLGRYLEFPPKTQYVLHAPFSWSAFVVFAFMILAVAFPLIIKGRQCYKKNPKKTSDVISHPFPWWGWIGVTTGIIAWILAWTRFIWFSEFQPHTFSPLWFSYIVVVNALCFWKSGYSLMTARTGYFLVLFPVSAAFWWFFEYLNRFVQNWYYVGVDFSPWAYFWYATLPFSTVLPAVLSTMELLLRVNWIRTAFGSFKTIHVSRSHLFATGVLVLSAAGLAEIGVWPNFLFPLLWVSPLLIIVSLQTLLKERHILSEMAEGNWSRGVAAALAAILCGGFWEMWNYFSLAKWEYCVPLVQRFQIFEMPLLGYAGYFPFGLECAVIGTMLEQLRQHPGGNNPL